MPIGGACTNPDHAYHQRIVDAGSYIGFDQIGMEDVQRNEVCANYIAKLVNDGFRAQVKVSMNRLCCYLGNPVTRRLTFEEIASIEQIEFTKTLEHTYRLTDFIPMLRLRGVSQAGCVAISEGNPRRFFRKRSYPCRCTLWNGVAGCLELNGACFRRSNYSIALNEGEVRCCRRLSGLGQRVSSYPGGKTLGLA